jgi:enterochelin esterase family protein
MVVVMPAGHAGPFRFGGARPATDEFAQDFLTDIMPYVEKNYRILTDRKSRAMAGLSPERWRTVASLFFPRTASGR